MVPAGFYKGKTRLVVPAGFYKWKTKTNRWCPQVVPAGLRPRKENKDQQVVPAGFWEWQWGDCVVEFLG